MAYTSPKVEVRDSKIRGKGVFAKEKILEGEMIFDFTESAGKYLSTKELDKLFDEGMDYGIQVGDDLFFAATSMADIETGDYLNHSCDPNAGISGLLKIVATRDIAAGEEITFDYAMSESHADLKMKCHCGKSNCRKVITGSDWKMPELQKRYRGYFSNYLQRKINLLKNKK